MARTRATRFVEEAGGADQLVEMLGSRRKGIDSTELLQSLTAEWGGADRLARTIKDLHDAAKPGSMARQRVLEMMVRLVVSATEREHYKAKRATDMSDEELARFAATLYSRGEAKDGLEASRRDPQGSPDG